MLPFIPGYATNNGHMFYMVFKDISERNRMIDHLKKNSIHSVFHYLSLHRSQFYKDKYEGSELPNSDHYTDCLLRLPLFFELTDEDLDIIVETVKSVNLNS